MRTEAKKHATEMMDSSDDGFRNYEQNKSKMSTIEIKVKPVELVNDTNLREVETSSKVYAMKD